MRIHCYSGKTLIDLQQKAEVKRLEQERSDTEAKKQYELGRIYSTLCSESTKES